MPRLFVAVRAPPLAELRRVIGRLARIRGVKAVPAAQLHYTLRFLGAVDEAVVAPLGEALRARAMPVAAFGARIEGTGAFPGPSRPRVVWAGCDEKAHGPFRSLADVVDLAATDVGLGARDKPFVPHLTLARVKYLEGRGAAECQVVLRDERETAYGDLKVDRVHLVESRLGPGGSVYTDLAEVMLS